MTNFLLFVSCDPDFIFIWWWKNNVHYSCEWVCGGSVFADANNARLYQESILEFVFIHQVYRNHCYSVGLFPCLDFLCLHYYAIPLLTSFPECYLCILFNFKGSRWWAEMGPSLHKRWLCGHGFTQWNGHAVPMQ